jgi:hypothetical protein
MELKALGLAVRVLWSMMRAKLRRKKGGVMNPKDALSVWDAFKTGTGIASWIVAVAMIGLAIAFVISGQISPIEAGLFCVGVVGWAIKQIRARFSTLKVQATTDAVLANQFELLNKTPAKK